MKPSEYLTLAANLIGGDRAAAYGDVTENHANIAQLWNGYLKPAEGGSRGPLAPVDVLHMMALLKIARTKTGQHKGDNYVDACGYLALAGHVAAAAACEVEGAVPVPAPEPEPPSALATLLGSTGMAVEEEIVPSRPRCRFFYPYAAPSGTVPHDDFSPTFGQTDVGAKDAYVEVYCNHDDESARDMRARLTALGWRIRETGYLAFVY